jgi:hypothetical protein
MVKNKKQDIHAILRSFSNNNDIENIIGANNSFINIGINRNDLFGLIEVISKNIASKIKPKGQL